MYFQNEFKLNEGALRVGVSMIKRGFRKATPQLVFRGANNYSVIRNIRSCMTGTLRQHALSPKILSLQLE